MPGSVVNNRKPLDPKAKSLLTAIAVAGVTPICSVPAARARVEVESRMARMNIPVRAVRQTTNLTIHHLTAPLRLRIYEPDGTGPFPVILFFHGGGWVFFDLDTYDPICSHLCDMSGCLVISADYRRAPEHRFPAATEDCLSALRWAVNHCREFGGDPEKIFVAGDSAGANLATVTAIQWHTQGHNPLCGQILLYPVTDHYSREKPSATEFDDGFGLSRTDMHWFWDQYLRDPSEGNSPMASPLLAETLQGLPPALVIVSGYDPLRDDGLFYANRLKEAGVPVTLLFYEEMIHGFVSYLGILKQGLDAIRRIGAWINETEKPLKG